MISFIFHFSRKRKFSLAGHFPRWLKLSHSWKCVALFKFGCLGEFLITCSHFYYLPPISVPKVSHVRQQFCGPDSVRKKLKTAFSHNITINRSGNIAHAQTKGVVNPAEILLTAVTLSSLKCNIFSVALKR